MAILTVNVASTDRAFALARAKAYTENYVGLALTKLPVELRTQLIAAYVALTGEQPEATLEAITIRAKNGQFVGLITPSFGVDAEGKPVIKFGNKLIPWNNQVKFKVKTYNFSGRGEDVCMMLAIKADKDTYQLPISIRFADYRNPLTEAEFESMLEECPADLFPLLSVQKVGGGNFSGGSIDNLSDLEIGNHEVMSYRALKVSYGTTYAIKTADGREFWADANLRNILAVDPVMPATLNMLDKQTTRRGSIKPIYTFNTTVDSEDIITF